MNHFGERRDSGSTLIPDTPVDESKEEMASHTGKCPANLCMLLYELLVYEVAYVRFFTE